MPAKSAAPRRPATSKATSESVEKRRGRPAGSKNKRPVENDDEDEEEVSNSRAGQRKRAQASSSSPAAQQSEEEEDQDDDMEVDEESSRAQRARVVVDDDDEDEPKETIPPALVTRILQEHFQKPDTRITKEANALAGRYVEIFVREAIVRAAQKKKGGFLDVEDLESISAQLLLEL